MPARAVTLGEGVDLKVQAPGYVQSILGTRVGSGTVAFSDAKLGQRSKEHTTQCGLELTPYALARYRSPGPKTHCFDREVDDPGLLVGRGEERRELHLQQRHQGFEHRAPAAPPAPGAAGPSARLAPLACLLGACRAQWVQFCKGSRPVTRTGPAVAVPVTCLGYCQLLAAQSRLPGS